MALAQTAGRHLEQGRGVSGRSVGGFSLIELLVVIVVIAIMAAILLPALSRTKEQTRGVACRANMKQLALAFLMYSEDNEDTFPWPGGPPGRTVSSPGQYSADWCGGDNYASRMGLQSEWFKPGFGLSPECGSVYPYVTSQPRREYDPNFKENNQVYRCPSGGRLGEALRVNFSANGWMDPGRPFGNGVVPHRGLMTTTITDPSHKALLLHEDPGTMISPAFPPNLSSGNRDISYHLDRANIAFMDGHMESVTPRVFALMRSRDVQLYFNAGK